MSTSEQFVPQQPVPSGDATWAPPPEQVEIVPRGILFSLAAIPLGMALSILIWKMGFVASISSFAIAAAAVWLYTKGSTQVPRRGLLPVIGVIVVGVVASFFAIVAADLVEFYGSPQGQSLGYPSSVDFVSANLFNGSVLSSYGTDLVMFIVFAALGIFGTLRRLVAHGRS